MKTKRYFDDRFHFERGQVGQTMKIYSQNALAKSEFWDPSLHTSGVFVKKNKKTELFEKGGPRESGEIRHRFRL